MDFGTSCQGSRRRLAYPIEMEFDVKAYLSSQISLGLNRFVADLSALTEEQRRSSPGGMARSPYDMAFELATVNNDLASLMKGHPQREDEEEGWTKAPEDFMELGKAKHALEMETRDFLEALQAVPEADLDKSLDSGTTSPLRIATMVNRHMHYHDAQLNYLQTLYGDQEVHWPG